MSVTVRTALFATYVLCLALVNGDALTEWLELSRADSSASHVVAIPAIALVLVYQRRLSVFRSVRFAWRGGLTIILVAGFALAALLYVPGTGGVEPLTVSTAIFLTFLVGGFLLFYGPTAFAAASFPLAFLVFMVPIPQVALAAVTRLLTIGSSEIVAALFTLSGTPYHREGFVFVLPAVSIHIADECSGIRSTIALVLTALLAAHLYLERGWNKALFVAAVLPLTILKNGIRIATLTWLAVHVDRGYLDGRLHHAGGIVFFLLALAIAVPLFVLLRKRDERRPLTSGGARTAVMPARHGA